MSTDIGDLLGKLTGGGDKGDSASPDGRLPDRDGLSNMLGSLGRQLGAS